MKPRSTGWQRWLLGAIGLSLVALLAAGPGNANKAVPPVAPKDEYTAAVRPLLKKYCLECHSTKKKRGELDLERFAGLDQLRQDLKPWQAVVEMLDAGEMPPKKKPQPTAAERQQLLAWTRSFLDAEARARAGDPGPAPLRRLSNAEYNCTVRDLTGVDLRPAREFPADGAAGEGFTNAAEALADISPTLLNKYLTAAKDIADHAVLLPDGFRFSPMKSRRDWTDESLASLRQFFAAYTSDGRLPLQPYLLATVRHRADLIGGKVTLAAVAKKENINPKYLQILWRTLTDREPSFPLDRLRTHWRQASEKDVPALLAEVGAWQELLWKFVRIGSYADGHTIRQVANDAAAAETQTLKLNLKPAPGQKEVVLYLTAREFPGKSKGGHVVWQRPCLEVAGKPALLLRDYAQFGPRYEVEYAAVFADTAQYLAAAQEAANDRKLTSTDLANKHHLNAAWLKRWLEVLALESAAKDTVEALDPANMVPAVALEMLDEKAPKNAQRPAINGWQRKGSDLPILITNASNKTEQVPGRVSPHQVAVHPTPKEFVAVAWKSPVEGRVRVAAKVVHAHPACGNGVAWWLEVRRAKRAASLAEGVLDVGGAAEVKSKTLRLAKGDIIVLAVDPRDGNHACDLTEITLTVTEVDQPGRVWDLAADVADNVLDGNPHADKLGNKDVWSFVRGPAREPGKAPAAGSKIPPGSVLGRWRAAATDPARREEAGKLAAQVQTLMTGARPAQENQPDRLLYDSLVSPDGALLKGLDPSTLVKARPATTRYGLAKERFGRHPPGKADDDANLVVPLNEVIEVRLPAALLRERAFVVDGKLDADAAERVVQFQVATAPPGADAPWDGKTPFVASTNSAAATQLRQGFADFRRCFPLFICYPRIIPDDEVVCLKLYHREDEPLTRLFLDDAQARRLNRLWEEQRFISQWPVTEHKNLPLFIGFVTQDQSKQVLAYFESLREPFRKRAEEFEKEVDAAGPKQLEQLVTWAARAYRRPLREQEKAELLQLYQALRKKGVAHSDAFRGVVARVLVSPSFLFRVEETPPGKEALPVNDWELASRLSYFLWSSMPDDELRQLAAADRLHEPPVLAAQTRRLLQDERARSLAVEFGTQWLHIRGFDELKEKNEQLFPTFDANLRKAIYEEAILFFLDLFQSDQPVTSLLDADYTFLNETLAKHYGIPGVSGPQWRKVEGVKKYGRGGVLGLASVQAKEAGASRTSPVLRGNWVVETLLGEKLPRPPPNVPQLPEAEKGNDGLTMRQLVQKHTHASECAVCHVRIDPFGFALERYDPIGRLRDKDLGGLPLDSRAKLKDGTEFEGLDGLRHYLLTKKKDVIVRLFCRRLLGYALDRAVTLSDQPLLDEMVAELNKNDGRVFAALQVIVRSAQFRTIRGREFATHE